MSKNMNTTDPRWHLLLGSLVFIVFLSVPWWADRGVIFLASLMLVHIVFALSFNTIFGLCGMISFGHAAYFAIGAYSAGMLLRYQEGVSLFLALGAGAVSGGLLALLIGTVALRRSSGTYFAILTLAFAELLHIVIAKTRWFGREDGLTGIRAPAIDVPFVGELSLLAGNNLHYVLLLTSVVFVTGAWVIWHSRLGRSLAAIRQEPDRASFLGINIHGSRLLAFCLSGVGAGLAGAMYAPLAQILTPDIARWSFSALPILFCLLGGAAVFWGPVIGVVAFLALEHSTRTVIGLSDIVTGAALLLVVLAFPGGIAGALHSLKLMWSQRDEPPLVPGSVEGGQP